MAVIYNWIISMNIKKLKPVKNITQRRRENQRSRNCECICGDI